ncbi:eIF2 kinase Gcn2p negative regulator [Chytriomyces hyalinus]|nr:eIF2 kinase Gcn2p negative regulator [Chytriomyces hyalinus]
MKRKQSEQDFTDAHQALMLGPKRLGLMAPPLVQTPSQILDRFSKFVSHSATVTCSKDVVALQQQLKHAQLFKSATHNITAWRFLRQQKNTNQQDGEQVRTNHGRDDGFIVQEGCDDDGEKDAGRRLLGVMRGLGVCDVLVVVSRWYGGTNLGPVRFDHINSMGIAALEFGGYIRALQKPQSDASASASSMADIVPRNWKSIADKELVGRQLKARTSAITGFFETIAKLNTQVLDKESAVSSLSEGVRKEKGVKSRVKDVSNFENRFKAFDKNEDALEKGQSEAEDLLKHQVLLLEEMKTVAGDLRADVKQLDEAIEEHSFRVALNNASK